MGIVVICKDEDKQTIATILEAKKLITDIVYDLDKINEQ